MGHIATPPSKAGVLTNDARLPLLPLAEWRGFDLPSDRIVDATGTTVLTGQMGLFSGPTFECPADMVVTQIAMASTATVSAGLTNCRYALYHIGRRPNLTDITELSILPIARTAVDTTMFNVANTLYQRSLSGTGGWPTSVRLVKGQRYMVGFFMAGTTPPTFVSAAALMRSQANGATVFPYKGGQLNPTGMAELPDFANGGNAQYSGYASQWMNFTCDPQSTLARPYVTALLGDSYFSGYAGFFGLANAQSASRLLPVFNAGVGGEQYNNFITRIAAVTAVKPQVVVLEGGVNDVANGRTLAAIQADITTLYTTLTVAGAKVIVLTVPPTTSMTAPQLTNVLAPLNTWIKALNVLNVYVSDTGLTLTTGDGVTIDGTKYVDGVHPNEAGRQAMAPVLATTIATVVTALGG